jgi:hypothetical protein
MLIYFFDFTSFTFYIFYFLLFFTFSARFCHAFARMAVKTTPAVAIAMIISDLT